MFLILLGTSLGIFVGAVPGLTGTMLIALILPLTYGANPQYALTLLISVYVGAVSGGMITSILLRMPGTPASIVTTFDGYPMAQKGNAERALGLGVMASFCGGIISWVFLVMLARPIALLSTKFGPFEYFSLVMMALVLIASIGGKSITRSLFSGFLGILLSMPGIAVATGQARLTFGIPELIDGFKLLPVLIGLFAVNQIFRDILDIKDESKMEVIETKGVALRFKDLVDHGFNMVRSSVIGTWIGLLPGIGANIGSVTAYTVAKSSSKQPEKFGTGHDEGVVAGEAANNATIGGALIPLISMGLPGSVVEAVLLGALVIHGLQPGPRLFEEHPVMVYTIMGAMLLASDGGDHAIFHARLGEDFEDPSGLYASGNPCFLRYRFLCFVQSVVRCVGNAWFWGSWIYIGIEPDSFSAIRDRFCSGAHRRRESHLWTHLL